MAKKKLSEPRWTDTHIIETTEEGRLHSRVVRKEKSGYEFTHSQRWEGAGASKEELVAFGRVLKWIHDSGFPTVVMPGSTGKSLRYALISAWKTLYPEEPMPKLYSISGRFLSGDWPTRGKKGKSFEKAYPGLGKRLEQPVVILDDLAHTGEALSDTWKLLNSVAPEGVKPEIKTAVMFAERIEYPHDSFKRIDFCGRKRRLPKIDRWTIRDIGYMPTIKFPRFRRDRRKIHEEIAEKIAERRKTEQEWSEYRTQRGKEPVEPLRISDIAGEHVLDYRLHRFRMEVFGEMAANIIIARRETRAQRKRIRPRPVSKKKVFIRHHR